MQRYMLSGGQVRKEADGHWVSFDSAFLSIAEARKQGEDGKIAYGRASFENGRKQGAEEERAAIVADLRCKGQKAIDENREGTFYFSVASEIKARGVEPVCTCQNAETYRSPNCAVHGVSATCRKSTEPKCTCDDGGFLGHHATSCPCYKPPELAPLGKLEDYGAVMRPLVIAINALIEHVNRIEARGRP